MKKLLVNIGMSIWLISFAFGITKFVSDFNTANSQTQVIIEITELS